MTQINILIVEDQENWYLMLPRQLRRLGTYVKADVARTYKEAKKFIEDGTYHLAIVDLELPDLPVNHEIPKPSDFKVIQDLRRSEFNQKCSLIVLTGHATSQRIRMAWKQFEVDDVLDKDDFKRAEFLQAVKDALYRSLIKRVDERRSKQSVLSVTFNAETLSSLSLTGPKYQLTVEVNNARKLMFGNFIERSDGINDLLSPPQRGELRPNWRKNARTIGTDLLTYLKTVPEFGEALATERNLKPGRTLSIEFRGPRYYLGVPFEVLNEGSDYLGLNHLTYRLVHWPGQLANEKMYTFHRFLDDLKRDKHKLRILLIASNSGTRMQAVDDEIDLLYEFLRSNLNTLGFDPEPEIERCYARQATLDHVKELLGSNHFHLIHYAGHGRFEDNLAEASGLLLRDGNSRVVLPTDSLNKLLRDSPTYLFFLSCCVGARTAVSEGSGDFLGIMDGIVQADVPAVLGYRWVITDRDAKDFAQEFYSSLFTTFSLQDALFDARSAVVRDEGRRDETWASPVMVLQNP